MVKKKMKKRFSLQFYTRDKSAGEPYLRIHLDTKSLQELIIWDSRVDQTIYRGLLEDYTGPLKDEICDEIERLIPNCTHEDYKKPTGVNCHGECEFCHHNPWYSPAKIEAREKKKLETNYICLCGHHMTDHDEHIGSCTKCNNCHGYNDPEKQEYEETESINLIPNNLLEIPDDLKIKSALLSLPKFWHIYMIKFEEPIQIQYGDGEIKKYDKAFIKSTRDLNDLEFKEEMTFQILPNNLTNDLILEFNDNPIIKPLIIYKSPPCQFNSKNQDSIETVKYWYISIKCPDLDKINQIFRFDDETTAIDFLIEMETKGAISMSTEIKPDLPYKILVCKTCRNEMKNPIEAKFPVDWCYHCKDYRDIVFIYQTKLNLGNPCPSCGSLNYTGKNCYECEAIRYRRKSTDKNLKYINDSEDY